MNATLPTTPGSGVRASAHMSPRVRVWEMHDDGRWHDTNGDRRSPGQLRDVTVLHVEPATDGKERAA